jgi:5-methylcytosine-specific restriction endonuclease McrA
MPLSVQRAEYLTDLRIECWPPGSHRWVALEDDGTPYAAAEHLFSDDEARRELVNTVYRLRGFEMLEEQSGLCARCGRFRPLQRHHRVFRSHGGTHARSNMHMLCEACHHKAHNVRKG